MNKLDKITIKKDNEINKLKNEIIRINSHARELEVILNEKQIEHKNLLDSSKLDKSDFEYKVSDLQNEKDRVTFKLASLELTNVNSSDI